MALTKDQKDRIEEEVKKILDRRRQSFPSNTSLLRNAPFHDLFLSCFHEEFKKYKLETPKLIAITSWMHGLNTSLGTGFENIAHILSGGYKRNFSNSYILPIKKSQANNVDHIIRELKDGQNVKPNLKRENALIFDYKPSDSEVSSLPFTVDNYKETNTDIDAIEIKSVRPNSGEGRGEKQKILHGKSALKLSNPNKDIKFYIAFPFDPTATTPLEYDKERFFNYLIEFKKFFDPKEVLLSGELWDHLTGEKDTMKELLETIKEIVSKHN